MWKKTKYLGVQTSGAGKYKIRGTFTDPKTGRRKEVERLIEANTSAEAAGIRATLLQDTKAVRKGNRLRVMDYAKSWITSKASGVNSVTAYLYADTLELHILPMLGEIFFDELSRSDVQKWVNHSLKSRKKDGSLYSVTSVHSWFRCFRTLCRDAVVDLELRRNPVERISFPELFPREERNALTADELTRFLAEIEQRYPQHYALVTLLAYTGLRFCHVSGIRWEDIDEQKGVIRIERKNNRGLIAQVSKRKRAPKEIPLTSTLKNVLSQHRQRMLEGQAPGIDSGWVFLGSTGKLRATGGLSKAFRKCCLEAGIKRRFTVHGLRRTFNDLARLAGIDAVVIRSMTGHVDDKMREYYSTVGIDEKHAAVAKVFELVPTRNVGFSVGFPGQAIATTSKGET